MKVAPVLPRVSFRTTRGQRRQLLTSGLRRGGTAGHEAGDGADNEGGHDGLKAKGKRRPMSQETKDKIAAARRGQRQSEETKSKISETMSDRKLSLSHRLRISEGRKEHYHSAETRKAISDAVKTTKRRLKKERLGERAARAAVAATADLRDRPTAADSEKGLILEKIELEKAVIEVTRLRDELTSWMDMYEIKYGKKPDLTETSETMPMVYGRFVRYVALRDLVRRSSVEMGLQQLANL